jgi:phosphatidylserine/phosphatidylglycerophosphate/cardiolipin synthase-like enzyme
LFERKQQREDLAAIAAFNMAKHRRLLNVLDHLPAGQFNHFKSMVIEKQNGDKTAYIGSHNFHPLSVLFGHAEVALRTTDPALIDQIEGFIEENLALSDERSKARLFGTRDVLGLLWPM